MWLLLCLIKVQKNGSENNCAYPPNQESMHCTLSSDDLAKNWEI